jgi:hypothetical protein
MLTAVPTIRRMPPTLTDYELETVARACRALAAQEVLSAKRIDNPALQATVAARAACAATQANRFEKARNKSKVTGWRPRQ